MAIDLTRAANLMKIHFAPRIYKQFNTAAIFWNRIMKGRGIPISDRGYEIPVHTGMNVSASWFDDGGPLAAGDGEDVERSTAFYKRFNVTGQLTGDAIDATSAEVANYARSLAFNVRRTTIAGMKLLNFYSFLDGTGLLGKSGANNQNLDGANKTFDVSGVSDGTKYFRRRMLLDIHDGVTDTVLGTVEVISVDSKTQITVSKVSGTGLADIDTGDGIYLSGSKDKVMAGLDLLVDDTDVAGGVQGIDRGDIPDWKANVISLTGSPALAREHLRRAIAEIQISLGMDEADIGMLEIWSHPAQVQAYASLGWPLKRFQGAGAKRFDAGFTAYEFEGIPWVIDTDAQKDKLYFLNPPTLFKVQARELSFDDRTGNILRQVPSSTSGRYDDRYQYFLIFRGNMGIYIPRANTKIKGLAIPSGY